MNKPVTIPELKSVYDMMSLKGKTALITGGGGGIGSSCAAGMAEVGASIMLVDMPSAEDRLQSCCKQIKDRYGVTVDYAMCDVADEAGVLAAFDKTVSKFGTVDVVFSNAGIGLQPDNPEDIPLETWKRMLDINLTGMFMVDRAGANIMKKHGHGGSIINTASMSGHIINKMGRGMMNKHMVAYASVKAATIHLAKSIAVNYADCNIRCNSRSPGMFHSGLHKRMGINDNSDAFYNTVIPDIPLGRWAQLDEIIGLVVFLASDLSSYVTGSDIVIDGGWTIW